VSSRCLSLLLFLFARRKIETICTYIETLVIVSYNIIYSPNACQTIVPYDQHTITGRYIWYNYTRRVPDETAPVINNIVHDDYYTAAKTLTSAKESNDFLATYLYTHINYTFGMQPRRRNEKQNNATETTIHSVYDLSRESFPADQNILLLHCTYLYTPEI